MSSGIYQRIYANLFIALPKKSGTIECESHRTISLMSQVTKLILRVLLARARQKIREHIASEQYGFTPDKGTTNATFILRTLSEGAIETQKDLFVCFIDYEKAFDNVRHVQMLSLIHI